ncbi:tRNA (adenosine(37)-N6)-dimethylallyltransferase MiaA [Novosphingobium sp. Leaf2]|uniref:tRNA (adenosine(37)-N6)-dimethylallyltransferase MiaA n=1 Tax=Novosphingobium sp. Leaf2 TaxID=1735670 RepID=UPI0006F436A5|nr:tRNA (adenosine(37)-N6)-dimethylallyltransferase MiaA [Novosphingobium sp. Leaf2]KQM13877.1 tRNA dimethylallyltransferase [Novosphingobium sp. Leaf2]
MSTTNFLDSPYDMAAGDRPPLALIAGPTASGKSDCAVALAQALERRGRRAVVINADSSQVYADLTILSARPTPEEMGGIEHRLFGAWDGAQSCSAADWAAAARAQIAQLHAQGAVPIVVGGTGLYIRTLLDGIAPVPVIDPQVRAHVRALPVDQAYAALLNEDPERAAKLGPADSARVARALEVVRSTGHGLAHWQARTEGGIGAHVVLHPVILLPERESLYARCDLRFARMLERGALDEVALLLARRLDPDLPVMRAIGVAELAGVIAGTTALEDATAQAAQATRNYAKRQFTWLRHQPPPSWPGISFKNFTKDTLSDILLRFLG